MLRPLHSLPKRLVRHLRTMSRTRFLEETFHNPHFARDLGLPPRIPDSRLRGGSVPW